MLFALIRCFEWGVILALTLPCPLQAQDLWKSPPQSCSGPCASTLKQTSEQLLIFISLSMPEAALKALHHEAQRCGATLVLRGLKNNSFKETGNILQKLGIQAQIDPTRFQTYQVQAVPTFVLIQGKVHDRMQGNVSLTFVLEQFAQSGDVKALAKTYLNKLKRGQ